MTAFRYKGTYYELTLYMDLWNNEIISWGLSAKRERPHDIHRWTIKRKGENAEWRTVLHSDQGLVYASEAYNDLLSIEQISHSMSRAGTPTDNAAMKSINGWLKEELFTDIYVHYRILQLAGEICYLYEVSKERSVQIGLS